MTKEEVKIMSEKIVKGVDLAYQRLLIAKSERGWRTCIFPRWKDCYSKSQGFTERKIVSTLAI